MNPQDVIAQQQALLNQFMQQNQRTALGFIALQVALLLLAVWVIYLFYSCFRRIEDEIRMFRIAYEIANPPKEQPRSRPSSGDNPFSKG